MPAAESKGYPTRLKDGSELANHDDWDCISDMEAAGLVEWRGTGLQPIITLTNYGWLVAARCVATAPRSGAPTVRGR